MRLKDKVAVVTGSSRGIGYGIAEGFIKEGAKVAVCGTTIESATKGADKLKAAYPDADIMPVALNVGSYDSVKAGIRAVGENFGQIDILVNNAGIVKSGPIGSFSEEDFISVMDINTTGIFRCIKETIPFMMQGGSIINISSINGIYGSADNSAYATSKAAIFGLTKSLGRELTRQNIRVNAVAPGVIATDMVGVLPDEVQAQLKAMTPVGRFGEIEDFQGICNLLASDDSSFITAAVFSVDGGALF